MNEWKTYTNILSHFNLYDWWTALASCCFLNPIWFPELSKGPSGTLVTWCAKNTPLVSPRSRLSWSICSLGWASYHPTSSFCLFWPSLSRNDRPPFNAPRFWQGLSLICPLLDDSIPSGLLTWEHLWIVNNFYCNRPFTNSQIQHNIHTYRPTHTYIHT